jgi:hypothetical protein
LYLTSRRRRIPAPGGGWANAGARRRRGRGGLSAGVMLRFLLEWS